MFFNLFFILQLVLRILHVLLQILTQSTPNSQQIKPINLDNKPTQIKPKSRNQSQQTQKNTIKSRSNPNQHNQTQIPPPLTNTIKPPPPHHLADQTKDPPHRSVTKPTEIKEALVLCGNFMPSPLMIAFPSTPPSNSP